MNDVYHIEIDDGHGNFFQFVSGPTEWNTMLKWLYNQMDGHLHYKAIIYEKTQNVNGFKMFNEVGRVRYYGGLKFYAKFKKKGEPAPYITPKGELVYKDPTTGRLGGRL